MLEIKHLHKYFDRFQIVDINLKINREDYFVLLGASGAGKSVLLELIAGITRPDKGSVFMNGNEITFLPVEKRKTGLIFQTPAIFPHLTVKENIAYPLFAAARQMVDSRVRSLAGQTGISHLLNEKPAKLSGGELQRLALARTLASDPLMLLLDEPLSAVDTPMKSSLRGLLRELNREGMPVLHVTHDFEEALALANKMAVIENGRIIQTGTPSEIINQPKSGFAAGFTGEHNFFKAEIRGLSATVKAGSSKKEQFIIHLSEHYDEGTANILIRSNHVIVAKDRAEMSTTNNFLGTITAISPLREGFEICIENGYRFYARITRDSLGKLNLAPGQEVWACFKASAVEVIR
ncbi:ABC transporter ATP-binding protein [Lentimicrobium sp.]|jgi:molybdopterin-binding protein|uniref:ABC transporter ATP-binding protein n=1 Tax=Lentimicrobium sp. TaxID=2034841 RepID=UPI0025D3F567|nr:ABC transporter ATP-binding protein [Lentimicrobium sp.]MCO5255949.1 ABC transporter ATP-binding protein [Lentimicrobium sp.]MCO5264064.1 ABC transporter ATP-binding protein [Lentimicrobium sp.]HOP13383.1 ABC transporter ATP-binding protein [Lentimicrobium sp.]HPF65785.1 ABC transporter ATP-binding protein [Lentimicrobium sp.]HPJ63193.1 ABC transporter ATP-binding protein [Lentimicrobium sp.]